MNSVSGNFGEFVNIILGGTPKTSQNEYWGGEIPWASVADFKDSKRIYTTEKTITQTGLDKSNTKQLYEGDIILSARGTVGKKVVCGVPMTFNQSCYALNPKNDSILNKDFLFYFLEEIVRVLKKKAVGGVFDTIIKSTIENIPVNLPLLPTQQKIASILSAYDDLIENNLKRIKLLEEAAQNIYKEWFVNFRFPGWEEAEFVDGFPKRWEMVKLESVNKNISSGGTPNRNTPAYWDRKEHQWVKTKELRDDFIFDTEEYISVDGLANSSAKLFNSNSILMAIYASPTLGRLGILVNEACCNQAAVGFIINEDYITNEFLYYKLLEERVNLNNLAIGAAQQNINVRKVKDHEILLPTKHIIDNYSAIVNPIFNQRKGLGIQNVKLKEARDILLPRLMNRTIEV